VCLKLGAGHCSGICKTRIQQQQTAAAEFGKFLLKTAMMQQRWRAGIGTEKIHGAVKSSFSLTRQAQSAITTGAFHGR
jgi:4-aminobutyrate aminotransferase-like enzyme